jgi:cytochrome c5
MKYLSLSLFTALTIFIATSCSTSKKVSTTTTTTTTTTTKKSTGITQADADYISAKMGATTIAELTEGNTIYTAECGVCHGLKKPSARTEDEWKSVVPRMVVKANAKAGKTQINSKQEAMILKYLVAMCNK